MADPTMAGIEAALRRRAANASTGQATTSAPEGGSYKEQIREEQKDEKPGLLRRALSGVQQGASSYFNAINTDLIPGAKQLGALDMLDAARFHGPLRPLWGWGTLKAEPIFDKIHLGSLSDEDFARMQEIARTEGYGAAADFNAEEMALLTRLGYETITDPLSYLAGAGLITRGALTAGKAGRASRAADVAAEAVRAAESGGDVAAAAQATQRADRAQQSLNRANRAADMVDQGVRIAENVQALPLTGPFKAAGAVGRGANRLSGGALGDSKVGQLFDKSGRSIGLSTTRNLQTGLEEAESQGIDPTRAFDQDGNLRQFTPQDILTTLSGMGSRTERAGFLSSLPDQDLGRVWLETSTIPEYSRLNKQVENALTSEGLLTRGTDGSLAPTARLQAHMTLDEALDQQQVSLSNREVSHDLIDATALALHDQNRRRFRTLDDAYSVINVRHFLPGTIPNSGPMPLNQAAEESTARGFFLTDENNANPTIGLTNKADATTLAHELAHLFRRYASRSDRAAISKALGRPIGDGLLDEAGEEWFAEAFENLLRTTDLSTVPPELRDTLRKWRQASQEVYRRSTPRGEMGNSLGDRLLNRLTGNGPVPVGDGALQNPGDRRFPTRDVRQGIDGVEGGPSILGTEPVEGQITRPQADRDPAPLAPSSGKMGGLQAPQTRREQFRRMPPRPLTGPYADDLEAGVEGIEELIDLDTRYRMGLIDEADYIDEKYALIGTQFTADVDGFLNGLANDLGIDPDMMTIQAATADDLRAGRRTSREMLDEWMQDYASRYSDDELDQILEYLNAAEDGLRLAPDPTRRQIRDSLASVRHNVNRPRLAPGQATNLDSLRGRASFRGILNAGGDRMRNQWRKEFSQSRPGRTQGKNGTLDENAYTGDALEKRVRKEGYFARQRYMANLSDEEIFSLEADALRVADDGIPDDPTTKAVINHIGQEANRRRRLTDEQRLSEQRERSLPKRDDLADTPDEGDLFTFPVDQASDEALARMRTAANNEARTLRAELAKAEGLDDVDVTDIQTDLANITARQKEIIREAGVRKRRAAKGPLQQRGFFHGTNAKFDEFTDQFNRSVGTYFTTRPEVAREYGSGTWGGGSAGRLLEVDVDLGKVLNLADNPVEAYRFMLDEVGLDPGLTFDEMSAMYHDELVEQFGEDLASVPPEQIAEALQDLSYSYLPDDWIFQDPQDWRFGGDPVSQLVDAMSSGNWGDGWNHHLTTLREMVIQTARDKGYDSVVFMDDSWGTIHESYVVLDPKRAKIVAEQSSLLQRVQDNGAPGQRPEVPTVNTADDLKQVIESGNYSVLTAWKEGVDRLTNESAMDAMREDLSRLGYQVLDTEGIYQGTSEPSFLVVGMNRDEARTLGQRYGQDSVMRGDEGLVYSDGRGVNAVDGNLRFDVDPAAEEFYSRVNLPDGSELRFVSDIDFDRMQQRLRGTGEGNRVQGSVDPDVTLDTPYRGDPVRTWLTNHAIQNNLPVENAELIADELEAGLGENIQYLSGAEMIFREDIRRILDPAMRSGDLKQIDRAIGDVLSAMNMKMMAFGWRHPVLDRMTGWAKTTKDAKRSQYAGRSREASTLGDQNSAVLRDAARQDEVRKAVDEYETARTGVQDIVNQINATNPRARAVLGEIDGFTTMGDIRRYGEWATPEQKKVIDAFFKEWLDEATVGEAWKKNILDAHIKAMQRTYGFGPTPRGPYRRVAEQILSTIPKAWREQAVASPRNVAQNVMDMSFKSAVNGVNPLISGPSVWTQAMEWGDDIPSAARTDAGHILDNRREEFARPGQSTVWGKILPGPVGTLAEGGINFFRQANRLSEDGFRLAAYAKAKRVHLKSQVLPTFRGQVRAIAREHGFDGEAVTNLLADMKAAGKARDGVSFSADQAYEMARANGFDERSARQIAEQWRSGLQSGTQAGIDMSHRVHFDVLDERNIEEWLKIRHWAPFHFFLTRNIPYYYETMAEHPDLFRLWARYESMSEEERKELGLTARMRSQAPIPGSPLLEFMLGSEGQAYANPMVVMSIADQFKPQYEQQDATLVGSGLDALGPFGLAPGPWISIPLQMLGTYGPNAEPGDTLRYSRLVDAWTGLDVEALPKRAVSAAQGFSTRTSIKTVTGSAIKDYSVNKRIAEMSLEITGRTNHPEFVQAYNDPFNPIWQAALQDVERQDRVMTSLGTLLPTTIKWLGDTERDIRGARAAMPEGLTSADWDALTKAGDIGAAYGEIPSTRARRTDLPPRSRSKGSTTSTDSVTTGDDPETDWGAGIWGPGGRNGIFGNPSVLKTYLRWRKAQPEGTDVSPDAFVAYLDMTYPSK